MSFLSAIITGMALGSMYGLLALGFHVTYAVSGTVNFSQGSSMTLGAVAGYFFLVVWGWPAAAGRSQPKPAKAGQFQHGNVHRI